MNNIKSFNEYTGQELERVAYDNVLNEKSILGGGLKGFFNRRAARKVKAELAEEIEMSKTIMDGIKEGLDSLNKNFDIIRKGIDDDKDEKAKGEKQKALDAIIKILEDSRKNTWDLNQLIDEGEIDYTGFTANIGIASVAYFGILFTPFRAAVMIHKGYSYFFNIIKNTIRKALVMLQLNFDQFENLIITKGFQSMDYVQEIAANQKLDDTIAAILKELCGEKTGMIKSKSKAADYRKNIDIAYKRVQMENAKNKKLKQSSDVYNNLDPYNNTYTKSLEALRQYSQDDVQKHLDSIKTSMSKLAGQEADLQVFGELILAAAEEHAYKVSTSIYNKFAKMTEVFSLPNQKKLIDLILAATTEETEAAQKKAKGIEAAKLKEAAEKEEDEGVKVFSSLSGTKLGKMNDETKKYDEKDIDADNWTYDEFNKLDDDKQQTFDRWLNNHPEVLKKCDDTLQTALNIDKYTEYVDMLIDYVGNCLVGKNNESYILDFGQYLMESIKKKSTTKKPIYMIDFNKLEDSQLEDVKKAFIKKGKKSKAVISKIALEVIGKKLLNDNTFIKNVDLIAKHISDAATDATHKVEISSVTYELLKKSIDKLKYLRSHDYNVTEDNTKKSED